MGHRIDWKKWLYDIFLPTENVIIEFNGDYWHMNPIKYSATDYNKIAHMTDGEIWEKDIRKKNDAFSHGYKVIYIWENDYKRAKNKSLFIDTIISYFLSLRKPLSL